MNYKLISGVHTDKRLKIGSAEISVGANGSLFRDMKIADLFQAYVSFNETRLNDAPFLLMF